MSDSDSGNSNIPPADECERRCQEFATVTGTDTALAMFYLQDRDWNLDRALNSFFEEKASEEPAASGDVVLKKPREDPHVVFLQEVVGASQDILEDEFPMYHMVPSNTEGYFTMMMLKTGHVQVEESKIYEYPTSMMMRNLLSVKCTIKGEKFCVMTSHLESTKEHAKERKNQLKKALSLIEKMDNSRTVVFGGDLNLRDTEVTEVGGLPDRVYDIWELTGKRPHAKFTWDTQRNDNLEWGSKFKPKCRFDRLYVKYAEPKTVKAEYFELVGIERLKSCQRFCSDHWGLLTHINILSKLPK